MPARWIFCLRCAIRPLAQSCPLGHFVGAPFALIQLTKKLLAAFAIPSPVGSLDLIRAAFCCHSSLLPKFYHPSYYDVSSTPVGCWWQRICRYVRTCVVLCDRQCLTFSIRFSCMQASVIAWLGCREHEWQRTPVPYATRSCSSMDGIRSYALASS